MMKKDNSVKGLQGEDIIWEKISATRQSNKTVSWEVVHEIL